MADDFTQFSFSLLSSKSHSALKFQLLLLILIATPYLKNDG